MTMVTFEQYMYRTHSRAELERWALRLRYFRFVRAIGGHANDPDSLVLRLRCGDDAEPLLSQLGAKGDARGCLGEQAWVSVCQGYIELSISGCAGDPYEVTDADVEAATRIEERLTSLSDRLIEPAVDSERCVCPKWYPEIWQPR
jgi:hypothetical protein